MSSPDLLEQGVGAGFYIADQIRAAPSAEHRARLLLRVSDELALSMAGALGRACFDTDFALGQAFLDARVAALCAVRDEAGLLPQGPGHLVEGYRLLMIQLARRA